MRIVDTDRVHPVDGDDAYNWFVDAPTLAVVELVARTAVAHGFILTNVMVGFGDGYSVHFDGPLSERMNNEYPHAIDRIAERCGAFCDGGGYGCGGEDGWARTVRDNSGNTVSDLLLRNIEENV